MHTLQKLRFKSLEILKDVNEIDCTECQLVCFAQEDKDLLGPHVMQTRSYAFNHFRSNHATLRRCLRMFVGNMRNWGLIEL